MSTRTITNMTDEDLRAAYLYYCDGIDDIVGRLKDAVVKNYPQYRETWFANLAYRYRCLSEIHEEFERRLLKNDAQEQQQ